MPNPFSLAEEFGSFVPSTNIWDVTDIASVDISSPEFKELLIRMYQNINLISLVLNTKDSGYYMTQEFVNSQLYFPDPALVNSTSMIADFRQVFRLLVNFGPLPNAGTTTVPHGLTITEGYSFTRIYGCASDPIDFAYVPIPYASNTPDNNIELSVDGTNVTITTAADWSAYTTTYVVLEYLKTNQ